MKQSLVCSTQIKKYTNDNEIKVIAITDDLLMKLLYKFFLCFMGGMFKKGSALWPCFFFRPKAFCHEISNAPLTLAIRWRLNTASSLSESVGEVDVSLCNNGAVQCGKLANHLRHCLFQQILLFALFHILFTEKHTNIYTHLTR